MVKFKSLLAAAAAVSLIPAAANAAWQKANVKDHLDGVIGVGAQLTGTAEVRGRSATGVLAVDCQKNSTTVVFTHRDWFVHWSRPVMRYKLDDQQPKTVNVRPSMNSKWVGWWDGAGIPFAKSLYGAKTLKVSILDHLNGEETTFTFDVEGAQQGLAEVAAACKWGK